MANSADTFQEAKAFLSTQTCLIVEPSQAFSVSIRACLQELGVSPARVMVANKFAQAKKMLIEFRPTILITEYNVESSSGLKLAELHETIHGESKRIAFITSKSSSASALANADEGLVDGYLLKPFSLELFRKNMLEIIRAKVEPSAYFEKIRVGKNHRSRGEFDQAAEQFHAAKLLDPKPTLACYHLGLNYHLSGDFENAIIQFREGRTFQPLHHNCIVGELEALLESKQFSLAAELANIIRKNFPLGPERLKQLFTAIAMSNRFDELPALLEAYKELEERTSELTQTAISAFFRAGQETVPTAVEKAISYFDIGLQLSGRSLAFVESVIAELINSGKIDDAENFLGKASPSDVGSPAHHRLVFRVNQLTMTSEQLLKRGRELIFAGHGSPEIFHIVVKSFAEAGKETMAESAIGKAVETFPELRSVLYQVLADNLPSNTIKSAA